MYLVGPYSKYIRKQMTDGDIIKNIGSLTCMININPTTGSFKIVEVPEFDLDDVTGGNNEYIENSSTRIIQLFNNTWLCVYPCPRKVMLDNIYEFKQDFTTFLNIFDIKPFLTTIKNPQANALV